MISIDLNSSSLIFSKITGISIPKSLKCSICSYLSITSIRSRILLSIESGSNVGFTSSASFVWVFSFFTSLVTILLCCLIVISWIDFLSCKLYSAYIIKGNTVKINNNIHIIFFIFFSFFTHF